MHSRQSVAEFLTIGIHRLLQRFPHWIIHRIQIQSIEWQFSGSVNSGTMAANIHTMLLLTCALICWISLNQKNGLWIVGI